MKKRRYIEEEPIGILRWAEATGVSVSASTRRRNIS